MTTFDEREQAFERKFIYDEEVRFKALARRNKRLGLWTAERIGLKGSDAESYAKALVAIDLRQHDESEIATKVRDDLQAVGASTSEPEIRQLMHELLGRCDLTVGRRVAT